MKQSTKFGLIIGSILIAMPYSTRANFFTDAKNWLNGAGKTISNAFKGASKEVQETVQKGINEIEKVTQKINSIAEDIKTFITTIINEIKTVVNVMTSSVNQIKTVIPGKITTNINTLIESIKKIPTQITQGAQKPVNDITNSAKNFEQKMNSHANSFASNIKSTISTMIQKLNTTTQGIVAGKIQEGVPAIIDNFGTTVTSIITEMNTTFTKLTNELAQITTGITSSTNELIGNTLTIDWKTPTQATVNIADNILVLLDAVHSAVSQLNTTVDNIGIKSLNLAGDFTDTSIAQAELQNLTGQEDGKITVILDDIKIVENKIREALKAVTDYTEKLLPTPTATT